MNDLAVTVMTGVCTELLKGQYDAAEIALDFGELEELLAKLIIGAARDVEYDRSHRAADGGVRQRALATPPAALLTSARTRCLPRFHERPDRRLSLGGAVSASCPAWPAHGQDVR